MRYEFNRDNYHKFDTVEINKLPPRSYFIPYPDRASEESVALRDKRYSSPKVMVLSGEWDFCFYPKPAEIPRKLDTNRMKFEKIKVPSCLQFKGYDRPFYLNTRYQFPCNPPHIPKEHSVGLTTFWIGGEKGPRLSSVLPKGEYNYVAAYRKFVPLKEVKGRYIISFLGVASCIDLYVNGAFVGYSEGSHNTAEFDITDRMTTADNEILVVVHRWCTGTYLECQDMFRNTGIFRDVLLYHENDCDIRDVDFKTVKNGRIYDASVSAKVTGDAEVSISLVGPGVDIKTSVPAKGGMVSASFSHLDVTEWNAENPVLYDLYVEIKGSCVHARVGFKDIKIKGEVFYLNGQKVKFHGVNHHDTSAVNGYAMTREEIEKDIETCKEYNIDTVRTSHYPPDPYFLQLCDEKGLYVVDEADIETHGVWSMRLPVSYNWITHDKKWADRYLDRAKRLYGRDKLHVAVTMWSLGNEAGGYNNTDLMYDFFKSVTDTPVHYESAIHSKRRAYDVGSQMYPPVSELVEIGKKEHKFPELNDRPYFLCEYAHAMGVGPGNIEGYWEIINRYDNLMGGCVWEMVDHAILEPDGSYTYGGDHGEWEHDGNFCVDGIFYPDRTPSTGAYVVKHCYRPIKIVYMGVTNFEVINMTSFTPGDKYKVVFNNGEGDFTVRTKGIGPGQNHLFDIEFRDISKNPYVTATVMDVETDHVYSKETFVLSNNLRPANKYTHDKNLNNIFLVDEDGFRYVDKRQPLVSAKEYTTICRAATDNDRDWMGRNTEEPFYNLKEEMVKIDDTDSSRIVTSKLSCKGGSYTVTDIYTPVRDGVMVTCKIHAEKGKGHIHRFGKTYYLPESFDDVEYFGRTGESYIDMKNQFPIGKVCCKVTDMTEPNIKPQESGNRCDCTEAKISNGEQFYRFIAVGEPFQLAIKPYSDKELRDMKHRSDEVRTGTYITIQGFHQGIGTGSCGPYVQEQFRHSSEEDITFSFIIAKK